MLARSGNLRVTPSTCVFALRRQRLDVRQIAESLHVSHILEGGLQKVGTNLRIRVRLVDARDNSTRWLETYDREVGDIFAVQDDVARAIAREVGGRLAGRDAARSITRCFPGSIEASERYPRGMAQRRAL